MNYQPVLTYDFWRVKDGKLIIANDDVKTHREIFHNFIGDGYMSPMYDDPVSEIVGDLTDEPEDEPPESVQIHNGTALSKSSRTLVLEIFAKDLEDYVPERHPDEYEIMRINIGRKIEDAIMQYEGATRQT